MSESHVCSWCGRPQQQVGLFVEGGPPTARVYICRECAQTAHEMFQAERAKKLGVRVAPFTLVSDDEEKPA